MSNDPIAVILFWVILMLGISGAGTVAWYAYNHATYVTERERVKSEQVQPKCDLPCNCRKFYNLSTWEWADCMGVGRVPAN